MRTVVLDPLPPEVADLIARRQRRGQDTFDEVWEGVYHMAPAPEARHGRVDEQLGALLRDPARRAGLVGTGPFDLGEPGDFRVPDRGYYPPDEVLDEVYLPTAALVAEVVSPGDETFEKLPFYAAHRVGEVIVADPEREQVRILLLADGRYVESPTSRSLGVATTDLERAIDWR